ncbi:MAG: alpha/beta hydrolase [Negativicutes bacterium]|nr:alpha/beta hydrolase [Negativicutes bacterium]
MSSDSLNQTATEKLTIAGPYAALEAVVHTPGSPVTGYVLVFCHGFRGSKDGGGRAADLAEKAAHLGFTVLRFDFTPQQMLTRQVEELSAVVEYCRANLGRQVILFGRSMGGSASLAFAAVDRDLAGLCLWATPWNLDETFRLSLGEGYGLLTAGTDFLAEDEWGPLHLTPEFIRDFANYDLLAAVGSLAGVPLLVVHGTDDAVVPLAQAEKLFETARQPKDIVVIPGGDHQFIGSHHIASSAVLDWLTRMFARSGI